MRTNPRSRVLAALFDIALMLGWAAFVGLVLVVVGLAGIQVRIGPFGYNLFSMLLVVLPVTIALTAWEAGRYEATPGKLRVGLLVRTDPSGDRVGWIRSLVRNLLKLGLPWVLAQFAVLAVVTSPGAEAALGVLIAVAVPATYMVSLFLGRGHTLYDWLTSTMVISTAPGRRFAAPSDPDPQEPPSDPEVPDAGQRNAAPEHEWHDEGQSPSR